MGAPISRILSDGAARPLSQLWESAHTFPRSTTAIVIPRDTTARHGITPKGFPVPGCVAAIHPQQLWIVD